jgi:hypothetical protein
VIPRKWGSPFVFLGAGVLWPKQMEKEAMKQLMFLACACVLGSAQPALAAMTFVQNAQNQTAATTTVVGTFGTAVTNNSLIVVCGRMNNTGSSLTASSNGSPTLTFVDGTEVTHSGVTMRARCFYALGNTGGATAITLTKGAGNATMDIVMEEWTGNATTTPLDQQGSGETTAASAHDISGTVTTTQCNELLISYAASTNAESFVAGAGFTVQTGSRSANSAMEGRQVTSTGSYGGAWTSSSTETALILLSTYKDATAGTCSAGPPVGSLMLMGVGR